MEQNKCPFHGTTKMKLGLNAKPSVHCIGSSLISFYTQNGSNNRSIEQSSTLFEKRRNF